MQTAAENPRVEFRDGQFLFRMANQEGGVTESFKSHASVREAFSGIAIDSGWLRPEIVRWGDGRVGEWAVAFIPPGVHELEITREEVKRDTGEEGNGETGAGGANEIGGAVPVTTGQAGGIDSSLITHHSSLDRIRVPLPGLVFFGVGTTYFIWAVKTAELDPYLEVYRCPLPNVEANALICWGPLKPPRATARTIFDAVELFIKSTFNNHRCEGKSKKFRDDVRLVLRGVRTQDSGLSTEEAGKMPALPAYPVDDLVRQVDNVGVTLDTAIREYFETGEMAG
jgi:hypothetical protein